MKARDVLHELWCDPVRWGDGSAGKDADLDKTVAELLAQTPAGEGIYIAPDGELWRVRQAYCICSEAHAGQPEHPKAHFRLVPIEEATDD